MGDSKKPNRREREQLKEMKEQGMVPVKKGK